jgi:hypothetical protein
VSDDLPRRRPPRAPLPPDYVSPLFPRDQTDAIVRFAIGVGVGYLAFHLPGTLWGLVSGIAAAVGVGALMAALFAAVTGVRQRRKRVRLIEYGRLWTLLAGAACAIAPEIVRIFERLVTTSDLPAIIAMVAFTAAAPFLVFRDDSNDEPASDQ